MKTCQLCKKPHKGRLEKVCEVCLLLKFHPQMRAFMLENRKVGTRG